MATYYGPVNNGFQLRMDVSHTQNVAANTTTVSMTVYLIASGYIASADTNGASAIAGVYVSSFSQYAAYNAGTHQVMSGARTVTHNSDGTIAAFNVSAVMGFPFVYGGLVLNVSTDYQPGTIPRATTAVWAQPTPATKDCGTTQTINLPRTSSAFTHDVSYRFEGAQGTIGTNVGTSVDWPIPLTLLSQIPNAASGQGVIATVTKNGATVVGGRDSIIKLRAPDTVVPNVSAVAWDDLNTTVKNNIGAFVQGLSQVRGTVTAAGVYGSTVTKKQVRIGGTLLPENTAFTVDGAGTVTASGEATDTRGRIGVRAANFTVLAYEPPKLGANGWQVRRANSSNVATDQGTYLRIDLHAISQSLKPATTEKNALKVAIFTRPQSGGAWTARNVVNPGLIQNGAIQVSGGAVFPITAAFDVKIELTDQTGVSATVLQTVVPTATITLDMDGTNVGIGGYRTRGRLEVHGDAYAPNWRADDGVFAGGAILDPLGSGKLWFTDTPPQGWLLCQGQAVSRTTYAALFAQLGTTWGAGDGTTTFNLPDMRGVVPVGKSSDVEFNELAKRYGTKTHTLTTAEMPSHRHSSPGTYNVGPGAGATAMVVNTVAAPGNSNLTGGGDPHNNVQPSVTVNWIIRAT